METLKNITAWTIALPFILGGLALLTLMYPVGIVLWAFDRALGLKG